MGAIKKIMEEQEVDDPGAEAEKGLGEYLTFAFISFIFHTFFRF